MVSKIIILSILLAITGPMPVYSQTPEATEVQPEPESPDEPPEVPIAIRNPFIPQLPFELLEPEVTVEEIIEIPEEEEITGGPDDPSQSPTIPGPPIIEVETPIVGNPTLAITGILWNSDRPQAIINGNIIEVGDKMFGVRTDKGELIEQLEIISIEKEGVGVTYRNKTVVISSGLEPAKGAQR